MRNKRRLAANSLVSFTAISVAVGLFATSEDEGNLESFTDSIVIQSELPEPIQVPPEDEPSEPRAVDYRQFEATAYCDYGLTFSGVLVQRGIVAADPSVLPIGSVIEVSADEYSGIYIVMDTGGLVKGKIIDIYMPDYEEAIQFGRQQVRLKVLRRGWLLEPSQ